MSLLAWPSQFTWSATIAGAASGKSRSIELKQLDRLVNVRQELPVRQHPTKQEHNTESSRCEKDLLFEFHEFTLSFGSERPRER